MSIVICLCCALGAVLVGRYYLHMYQLESYQADGYVRWLKKNPERQTGSTLLIGMGSTLGYYVLWLILRLFMSSDASRVTASLIALAGYGLASAACVRALTAKKEKKPLVYTARMKRQLAVLIAITLLAGGLFELVQVKAFILMALIPYLTLLSGLIMSPIEKAVSQHYLDDARRKLEARPDLIKIGITGSYGKTSTKFILATILEEKYDVLATPASFNTPMGLTRVIREQLEPHHQVFIAEMGARHVGDIQELVDLVKPKYGLLTSVGPQHLETFGSIENIADTKFELIAGLPKDGVAFFAADGGEVDKLYMRARVKKYLTGTRGMSLDMKAEDVAVSRNGSTFVLRDMKSGDSARCETRLLGIHNISNIVLAACAARELGLNLREIARGIRKIKPIEHRLQLIAGSNGMTVIDDAFNANPVGAKRALDVLSGFEGRHVIVTPGMVEQGAEEEELNRRFGAQMVGVCDVVILVGKKHTRPIVEGLMSAGMDEHNMYLAADLDEATAFLGKIARPGDVILFENDLPDNYNEN
ncbi:MAG: UDP-N-acetylmuramoyl-tripeptide--D-alanyl-D-alanine ligase [Clostridia bacterium]|nr:UDP-N-acetylmuramoyl-tripeptide--D-alanyl-D-alanine ligase [Clostridia bacterium]